MYLMLTTQPDNEMLGVLVKLVEKGDLRVILDGVWSMDDALEVRVDARELKQQLQADRDFDRLTIVCRHRGQGERWW